MKERVHFGCMMVKNGEADAVMVAGPSSDYSGRLAACFTNHRHRARGQKNCRNVYPAYQKGPLFLADATVNMNPYSGRNCRYYRSLVAKEVKTFNMKPRIALLSYSNFGSSPTPEAQMMAKARKILKKGPQPDCGWRNARFAGF
jgi:malate dehydrogenase (oxaloacetate-decarboxylating)(NADP+)